MHKVFVYGSLLSGMGNHGLLKDAVFVGKTTSPPEFLMIDIGYFPGVIEHDKGMPIVGEVYEVTDEQLNRLDILEGYRSSNPEGGLYNRREIDTEFGKALIYVYNNHFGRNTTNYVPFGDWKTHYNKKTGRI